MKKIFLNTDPKLIMSSLLILLISFSLKASKKVSNLSAKIYINIEYKQAEKSDTLYLSIAEDILFSLTSDKKKKFIAVPDKTGIYHFQIPVTASSGYFVLSKSRAAKRIHFTDPVRLIEPQYWEQRDSINVQITKFKETTLGGDAYCVFSGRGSEKYNLMNEISHFELPPDTLVKSTELWPKNWYGNILEFDGFDSTSLYTKAVLDLLESRKKLLTDVSYQVIKANLIYRNQSGLFGLINQFGYDGRFKKLDEKRKQAFTQRLVNSFQYRDNYGIPDNALANSIDFLHFLSSKVVAESYLNTGGYDLDYIYQTIKSYPISKEIRETLMIKFLLSPMRGSQQAYNLYANAKSFIKNPIYLPILEELKYKLPGRKFTELDLEDVNGAIRSLSEFKDKVVLLDFWFTGCGHCEVFYKTTLSKVEKSFKDNADIVFISVSLDQQKLTWKKSIDKGIYTSPDAINVYTNGLGSKHPVVTLNNIGGCPTVVLLDKSGKIQYFNTSNLYDEEQLIKALENLL